MDIAQRLGETHDPLLIGVRHHGRAERILLGSFASHLAYNAPCAVLLVHPPTPAG